VPPHLSDAMRIFVSESLRKALSDSSRFLCDIFPLYCRVLAEVVLRISAYMATFPPFILANPPKNVHATIFVS